MTQTNTIILNINHAIGDPFINTTWLNKNLRYGMEMYYLFMYETWEHVSVHWKQGNHKLWANCFMCWNPVKISAKESQGNSATCYYSEYSNH